MFVLDYPRFALCCKTT